MAHLFTFLKFPLKKNVYCSLEREEGWGTERETWMRGQIFNRLFPVCPLTGNWDIPGPAVSTSPECLLEMQSSRLHPDLLKWNLHFNKVSRWSVCAYSWKSLRIFLACVGQWKPLSLLLHIHHHLTTKQFNRGSSRRPQLVCGFLSWIKEASESPVLS